MSNLVNFLEETIECLNQNGKTEEDVLWVGRGFGKYEVLDMSEKTKAAWEDLLWEKISGLKEGNMTEQSGGNLKPCQQNPS